MTPLDLIVWGAAAAVAIVIVALAVALGVTIVQAARTASRRQRPSTVHVTDASGLARGDRIRIGDEEREVE